jgi:hypothetical protein
MALDQHNWPTRAHLDRQRARLAMGHLLAFLTGKQFVFVQIGLRPGHYRLDFVEWEKVKCPTSLPS